MHSEPTNGLPSTIREMIARMESEGFATKLLTTQQTAAYLNVTAKTVAHWRTIGKGPEFIQLSDVGSIRYHWADVLRWLADRTSSSTLGASMRYLRNDLHGEP